MNAYRDARALAAGQFRWDNAEPEIDPVEITREAVSEALDDRDPRLVREWAAHVNLWLDGEAVHDLLIGLLSLSDQKWDCLRHAMRCDLVAEPLHAIWLRAQELRGEFVDCEAERLVREAA